VQDVRPEALEARRKSLANLLSRTTKAMHDGMRAPAQSELRDEAKKLLTVYLANRAERVSREDRFKAA
jgi:hypothetical protein